MTEEFASGADLFDVLPCGVVVTDAKGTVLDVNKTFCSWVGLDASDLVSKRKLQDLYTVGGRIFHQTHWLPVLQMQGSLAEVKFDVRRSDGVVLPMMVNAVRKKRGAGSVDVITLTVAEERNKYERELLAARQRADDLLEKERATQLVLEDRALFAEQLIGIVSHDLRNPLAAILTGIGILDRHVALPEERRDKLLRTVMSSARSAQRLVEDLLDFTIARVGRALSVARRPVHFHALIARIVETLSLAFPGRALRHQIVGDGDGDGDGEILVDADRMAQLIGNLVGNAMAYGDPTAPVTVTSELAPTRSRISVHNVGPSIPGDLLESMFQPLVRGTPSPGSNRSVGLGLFIVRAIATAHDGDVDVVSSSEEGTTFTFSFSTA